MLKVIIATTSCFKRLVGSCSKGIDYGREFMYVVEKSIDLEAAQDQQCYFLISHIQNWHKFHRVWHLLRNQITMCDLTNSTPATGGVLSF